MAAPYHLIRSKCERALVAYLISENAGDPTNCWQAKRSHDKILPEIICWADKAVEDPPYSSSFLVQAQIQVKTLAAPDPGQDPDQMRIGSDAFVGTVFDLFHTDLDQAGDKLGENITLAARAAATGDPTRNADLADFTIQNVMVKEEDGGFEEDGSAWVDSLSLEIRCCPGDILG